MCITTKHLCDVFKNMLNIFVSCRVVCFLSYNFLSYNSKNPTGLSFCQTCYNNLAFIFFLSCTPVNKKWEVQKNVSARFARRLYPHFKIHRAALDQQLNMTLSAPWKKNPPAMRPFVKILWALVIIIIIITFLNNTTLSLGDNSVIEGDRISRLESCGMWI